MVCAQGPVALMGAGNVIDAFQLWAGKVPPLSMQVLAYMAAVSVDKDPEPWFGLGHKALAEFALGRPQPLDEDEPGDPVDLRAVRRAIQPLLESGAVYVIRRASPNRVSHKTVRYGLNVGLYAARHRTEFDRVIGRNPVDHRTHSVTSQDELRPTEEYEEDEELQEEEVVDLPADLTVSRACEHGLSTHIRCPACARGIGQERHLRAV
jgi:hypothetical protein